MTAPENAALAETVAREQVVDKAVRRTNKRGCCGLTCQPEEAVDLVQAADYPNSGGSASQGACGAVGRWLGLRWHEKARRGRNISGRNPGLGRSESCRALARTAN